MLKKIFMNTKNPNGLWGKFFLWMMNKGHRSLSNWGFSHISIKSDDRILDIGCGGGQTLASMLKMVSNGKVYGLDHSLLSVEKSIKFNPKYVDSGKCIIFHGSVSQIPIESLTLDLVTAFETVYFWTNFKSDSMEVFRVLKFGGKFLICNEVSRKDDEDVSNNVFVKTLDLMVYSPKEFEEILESVGFKDVKTSFAKNKKFMCVIAEK